MSFPVQFYQFTKRENSTAIPGEAMSTYQCVLKGNCSIIEPEIVLGVGTEWTPANYNYAHIAAFNRYYFVTNWTFANAQWVASLKVDVLASYKAAIGASRQYVLRSSAEFDGAITDTLYPTKNGVVLTTVDAKNPWGYYPEHGFPDGAFVLGIINADPTAVGSVSYYAFTYQQLQVLKSNLMSTTDWLGTDFGANTPPELLKAQFNPFQYIISCKWFPTLDIPVVETLTSLPFGWWTLPTSCEQLSMINPVLSFQTTFTLPKHPDSVIRGKYLNSAPFTRYSLFFPPFGNIPLDPAGLVDSTTLYCFINVDIVSGTGVLFVTPSSDKSNVIARENAAVGVPIQLAQMTVDHLAQAQTAITTVGNIVSAAETGNIGGLISGTASGIISSIQNSFPQLRTSGANGAIVEYSKNPQLYAQFFKQVEESNTHRGRPLCKEKTISTIPGYIMVADADISLQATQAENQQIKKYMEGGFFYE